jgi:hypothetical protein
MEQFTKMFDINEILKSAEKNAEVFLAAVPTGAVKTSVQKLLDAQFGLAKATVDATLVVAAETRKALESAVAVK